MDIDANEVYKLAQLGCLNTEISNWFNCDEETIARRFKDELNKGRANLKMSLRKYQLEAAKKGNVAMLIWLGKQMLGQSEKTEVEINGTTAVLSTLTDEASSKIIKAIQAKRPQRTKVDNPRPKPNGSTTN